MINKELQLAQSFVENTNRNLFLTGKAGTGKTTFLHHIKNNLNKRFVVVAPTGVAAINAQGVTIHSFFQMPFGPLVPEYSGFDQSQKKFNKQKINIIRTLDLLVIDEISMVRADLLDAIDRVLRRYKQYNKPFGGVQLLLIGDIQQLAPVIKPDEWALLSHHYETPYFFSSKAYKEANVLSIELKKIYRQENKVFIDLLEDIRTNQLTEQTLELLNSRFQPDFEPPEEENFITLTTHNQVADTINAKKLNAIKEKSYEFDAQVQGDFPEHVYPTEENLTFKKGAQVMFIKNDSNPEKRYYNGKIGVITAIGKDYIEVQCPEDDEPIDVSPESWDNTRYSLDKTTKEIKEEFIGKFTQIPLKLAWAITIHKSQGLTFDKAVIDASASFAHGQTYVALSRCRTLEGIVLRSKISKASVINDQRVQQFTKDLVDQEPDEKILIDSQKDFQLNLIAELFDFYHWLKPLESAQNIALKNQTVVKGNITSQLKVLKDNLKELVKISHNFYLQLRGMSKEGILPENDSAIQQRIMKGMDFYKGFLNDRLEQTFNTLTFDTDNKDIKEDINKHLETVEALLNEKKYLFEHIEKNFNAKAYMRLRAQAQLQKTDKKKIKVDRTDYSDHPELFKELRALRVEYADIEMVPLYQVFTQESLYQICEKLPVTLNQLKKIKGMGKVRVQRYGQDIIDIVHEYCEQNNMTPDLSEPEIIEKTKPKKGATYQFTFELQKEGLTIAEIAQKRSLAVSTIEGHMAKLISEGQLKLEEVLPDKRYQELKAFMQKTNYESLNDLRQKVGEDYSFGELRIIHSAIEYEQNK